MPGERDAVNPMMSATLLQIWGSWWILHCVSFVSGLLFDPGGAEEWLGSTANQK